MNLEPSEKQAQVIHQDIHHDIARLTQAFQPHSSLWGYGSIEQCLYIARQITFKLKLLAGYSPE